MQSLETLELENSSTQPSNGSPVVQGINPLLASEGQPLITNSAVDTALLHAMSVELNALNATPHQILHSTTFPTPGSMTGNDVQAPAYTTMSLVTNSICQSAHPNPTVNQALQMASVIPPTRAGSNLSSINDSIEQAMAKGLPKWKR